MPSRQVPLNDFYTANVRILANGCVPHALYLCQVKEPPVGDKCDLFGKLAELPSPEAFPPPGEFGYSLAPA